jgi:hypothetical protein
VIPLFNPIVLNEPKRSDRCVIRRVANRRTSSPGGKSPCAVITDYGNPILGLDQLALEIKPADSWQSDVEGEAACNIGEEASASTNAEGTRRE